VAEQDVLRRLADTIRARRASTAEASYTKKLLDAGAETCARKFGEEAIEIVIAGVRGDTTEVAAEAADVLFHLLVLLEARGVAFADVATVLEGRMGTSGHAEKASRGQK
jgi:phosphoribosyl-ATP pyrophosphohydrolase